MVVFIWGRTTRRRGVYFSKCKDVGVCPFLETRITEVEDGVSTPCDSGCRHTVGNGSSVWCPTVSVLFEVPGLRM